MMSCQCLKPWFRATPLSSLHTISYQFTLNSSSHPSSNTPIHFCIMDFSLLFSSWITLRSSLSAPHPFLYVDTLAKPSLDHLVYNHTCPFPVFPYLLNVLSPLHNTNILFIYTFIWLLSVTPCPNPTPPWRLSLWTGLGLSFLFSAVHLAPRMELGIW